MTDALKGLKFETTSDFIKFKADQPVKLRVLSVNPLIADSTYTNDKTGEITVSTKYAFAVWNYGEERAMILNATPTIAQNIHRLHTDEDYGEDVTKLDIKIEPTGELLERRYTVNVLPKAQALTNQQEKDVLELDKKLETIIKNGIRADEYNEGKRLSLDNKPEKPSTKDVVIEDIGDEPINLDEIPF